MISRKLWSGAKLPALGLGCWAIGGPFFADETPLGWGKVDDTTSIHAIHMACDLGIPFFDTAQVYGAGHSEEVLGRALAGRKDVLIGTKVGYAFDTVTRQVTGEVLDGKTITQSLQDSLKRLRRDQIDLVHFHLNEASLDQAEPVFETLGVLRNQGIIGAFGWSTDFPDRAAAFAEQDGFVSVEHAMNVFFRAEAILPVIEKHGLWSINRSPLAMGLLSGKYNSNSRMPIDDIRSQSADWMAYYREGSVVPEYAAMLDAVRELLQTDGRTLVQGALAWLWARSECTLPIPGFRNGAQVKELAGAMVKGALPPDVMQEIERVIVRPPEGAPKPR
jgi:aryl-alcohol dehydrogenase-like predicted oxidoreductase